MKILGTQPYRCKSITIFKGSKSFKFECLRNLIPCSRDFPDNDKCKMSSEVDGSVPYEVTIKTSDELKSGISQTKLIAENGFKRGSSKILKININDIGETQGFKVKLSEGGKWKPSLLIIKNLSIFNKFYNFSH